MSYRALLILIVLYASSPVVIFAQLVRAIDHVMIDDAKIPFGTTIEIEGEVRAKDFFSFSSEAASLRVVRIANKPIQHEIDFHLHSDDEGNGPAYDVLRVLEKSAFYRVRGRVMNARFNGTGNTCALIVEQLTPIPAISLKCQDFVDQKLKLEGTAAPAGKFLHEKELIALEGLTGWPHSIEGRQIEVRGTVRRGSSTCRMENPEWKLIQLNDQINQKVSLDGKLWSLNGEWWFDYRGERLYLTSDAGPVMAFKSDDHGRPARVSGLLLRQLRPAIEQISLKSDQDLVDTFVVRGAQVKYLDAEASWSERFGTVYPSFNRLEDGVPVLLAESSFRRNILGTETHARLIVERNHEAIEWTLRETTEASRNVLARRMNDDATDKTLRLIYASMLASANDGRGRDYLLRTSKPVDDTLDLDALYCLGVFPFLSPRHLRDKVELDWAEDVMIALLKERKPVSTTGRVWKDTDHKIPVASAVVIFTNIPTVLAWIGSVKARSALLDYYYYALPDDDHPESSDIVRLLCQSKIQLSIDDLLKLEAVTKDSRTRRVILLAMLRGKSTRGIDRFLVDLESNFVYMDLRNHLSKELLDQLQPLVERSKDDNRNHLLMLKVLAEKDPIPELLSLLTDQNWPDKPLIMFELGRLADPRAVPIVARVLRESPQNYFDHGEDSELRTTGAIQNGLKAIADTGTPEAIQELIGVLPVDLSRFGSYINRAGLQGIVAAHLIQLTGESFGVDAEAWRKWQQAHPTHAVKRELLKPDQFFRTDVNQVIDLGQ